MQFTWSTWESNLFRSIFGGKKQEVLSAARIEQFREAWLLANRSLLGVKSDAFDRGERIDEFNIVRHAQQWIRETKISFTSDSHKIEQLTCRLLPLVHDVYLQSDRFGDEADVSSAHNSTTQIILELVTQRIRSGEKLRENQPSEELSQRENKILHKVQEALANYWDAK